MRLLQPSTRLLIDLHCDGSSRTDALDIITVRSGTTQMDLVLEFFQSKRDNKQVGVVEVKL